jgi:hypothetical protein
MIKMRILFLTNFYLVHGSGGEEQSCQQVVEGLKQRGHTTLVLTSMRGSNNLPVEVDGISGRYIWRWIWCPCVRALSSHPEKGKRKS